MKKLIGVVISVLIISCAAIAAEYFYLPMNMTVGPTNVLVLAPTVPYVQNSVTWTNNTLYPIGTILSCSSGMYHVITSGLVTNSEPTHLAGDVANGFTTLRYVNKYRNAAYIVNDSANIVYLSTSTNAVINKGIRLSAGGGVYVHTGFGPVYGYSASGSIITIQEM